MGVLATEEEAAASKQLILLNFYFSAHRKSFKLYGLSCTRAMKVYHGKFARVHWACIPVVSHKPAEQAFFTK